MDFYGETEIPANTPSDEPLRYSIGVDKGIIDRIYLFFPWGCAALCYIRILRRNTSLAPHTRERFYHGNDILIVIDVGYEIKNEPYELIAEAYNDDDTYPHTPVIRVEMHRPTVSDQFQQFVGLFKGD